MLRGVDVIPYALPSRVAFIAANKERGRVSARLLRRTLLAYVVRSGKAASRRRRHGVWGDFHE
jgi:hypothetical protein